MKILKVKIRGKTYIQQREDKGRILSSRDDISLEQAKRLVKKKGIIKKGVVSYTPLTNFREITIDNRKTLPRRVRYGVTASMRFNRKVYIARSQFDDRTYQEKEAEAISNLIGLITGFYESNEFDEFIERYGSRIKINVVYYTNKD